MKSISLTQGKVAMVSDHRYAYLNLWKWCAQKTRMGTWYAVRDERQGHVKKRFYMHREIMDAPKGMEIDHRDGDGLNNVDENLRICTHSQNMFNNKKPRNNTSGFKGVSLHRKTNKWFARIRFQGHIIYVGFFDNPEDAAHAYDKKAVELFGEFAKTNF